MINPLPTTFRPAAVWLAWLLGLAIPCAHAADLNPRQVGRYTVDSQNWSPVSVAASGSNAYVIYSDYIPASESWVARMLILDVSNSTVPAPLGTLNLPTGANHLLVRDDLAYVSAGGDGLILVDVSNAQAPRRKGSYNTGGHAVQSFLVEDRAYIADSEGGLVVLDVGDPANLRPVGGRITMHEASSVFVSGNYAYLAERYYSEAQQREFGLLEIMDIRNPANPELVGTYPLSFGAWSVLVAGNVAYVGGGSFEDLELIDVSDPASPQPLGNYGPAPRGIISGTRAYMYDVRAGLHLLDLSDPGSPKRLGGFQHEGYHSFWGVGVSGSYAYVGVNPGKGGLAVIDLSLPANLPRVAGLSMSGSARDISISGTRAYLATSMGLQIVDIADPQRPVPLGLYPTTDPAGMVVADGQRAYVMESWKVTGSSYGYALHVVDVSNPNSPTPIGLYQTSGASSSFPWGGADSLAVSANGQYAFLAVAINYSSSVIEVIDLSIPSQPLHVATHELAGMGVGIVRHGQQLLVGQDGLLVLDVSNPESPRAVGQPAGSGWISRIAAAGSRAFTCGSMGFQVFDLSDPSQPVLLGTNAAFGLNWNGLAVSGNYVYGSAAGSGVQVVDVSDPANPQLVGGNSAVLAAGLGIAGDHVFVAGYSEGLQVFDLTPMIIEPSPSLRVAHFGDALTLSWPASAIGFTLEASDTLLPATAWTPEPTAPEIVGEQNVVTLDLGGVGARFFRLKMP